MALFKYVLHYITDVCDITQQLKCRKSCGPDGIPAKALKFGGFLLAGHITLLFNMFSCHCYLPSDVILITLVSLIINKSGDATDINNCRAIALSNSISKVLEGILQKMYSFS